MNHSSYHILPTDNLLVHAFRWPRLLHDHDDSERLEIEALAASGDCFITLATSLDDSTKLLKPGETPARPQIEKAIRTLLYLQRHYHLARKLRSEYRQ